jgi:magnesium transporter
LQKAIVLTLFIPLIMSSGGNSGSQATSLVIRALALDEIALRDWWRVALRELPMGIVLGAILGLVGMARIALWQHIGLFDYGPHWLLLATTVGLALVGIVTFGSLAGSMLPFALKRAGFDPASASAPFVATLATSAASSSTSRWRCWCCAARCFDRRSGRRPRQSMRAPSFTR